MMLAERGRHFDPDIVDALEKGGRQVCRDRPEFPGRAEDE